MLTPERDCKHGRQIGKCVDCDLDHMEMAAAAEARRVDELTALRKDDEALIRQMLEALEKSNLEWKGLADSGDAGYWKAEDQTRYQQSEAAITAARAHLEKAP